MFWFCLLLFGFVAIVSLFFPFAFQSEFFSMLWDGMGLHWFWIRSIFTYTDFAARMFNINLTEFFPCCFWCITKDLSKLLSSSKCLKPCTQNETKSCFGKYREIIRNLRYCIFLKFLAKIFYLIYQILAI